MWKRILNTSFYLSFTDKKEIYVTDFITIWTSDLSEESFLKYLKDSNPELHLMDVDFISRGQILLSKCNELEKAVVEPSNDRKKLNVNLTISFSFPFHLNVILVEGSKELFFFTVTQNLLKTMDDLQNSEAYLRPLLMTKDSEINNCIINDYGKAQSIFTTSPFNHNIHIKNTNKINKKCFGQLRVPCDLLVKTKPSDCTEDDL